jgi:hypothetical protein
VHLLKLLCTLHGQSWVDMFQVQVQQQREGRLAGMKCCANGMLLLLSVYSIQGIDCIFIRDRHSVAWMTCMCAKHAAAEPQVYAAAAAVHICRCGAPCTVVSGLPFM